MQRRTPCGAAKLEPQHRHVSRHDTEEQHDMCMHVVVVYAYRCIYVYIMSYVIIAPAPYDAGYADEVDVPHVAYARDLCIRHRRCTDDA